MSSRACYPSVLSEQLCSTLLCVLLCLHVLFPPGATLVARSVALGPMARADVTCGVGLGYSCMGSTHVPAQSEFSHSDHLYG